MELLESIQLPPGDLIKSPGYRFPAELSFLFKQSVYFGAKSDSILTRVKLGKRNC
jgi:hypothetical protein